MPRTERSRVAVCVAWLACAGAAAALSSNRPAARAQQEDKPVEQVRKNIQVLKGLPDSQLLPLMNFVSASLGVRCDTCHVVREKADGGRDWLMELDDKPIKQTARQMMRMVLSLNHDRAADFRGNAVSCFTCHRGERRPASFPSLPLAASPHEPIAPAAAAPAPAPLPSVKEVFDKYEAAVGGRAAAARLKTSFMKGTREASQGRNWPMEVTTRGDEQFLMVVRVPEQGTFAQALDGAGGWVKNPRVTRELNAAELGDMRRVAALLRPFKVSGPSASMRVVGRETLGGREAFVVEDGAPPSLRERLFFDAGTGLLLRRQTFSDALLFPVAEQTDFEDYREADGLKLPFVIRTSNIDTWFSVTRRFTEIRHNQPVDESVFKLPAAPRD